MSVLFDTILSKLRKRDSGGGSAGALTWKGTVATVVQLPQGSAIGDTYTVTQTALEYTWTGTSWQINPFLTFATNTTKGIANFPAQQFIVADGAVSIKETAVKNAVAPSYQTITGTAVSKAFKPNTVYTCSDAITSLDALSFPIDWQQTTLKFKTGTGFTASFNAVQGWVGDTAPTFQDNTAYILSWKDGIGVLCKYIPMQDATSVVVTTTAANQTSSISFPAVSGVSLNATVDWGDGSAAQTYTSTGTKSHTYATAGTYTLIITGVHAKVALGASRATRITSLYSGIKDCSTMCNGLSTLTAFTAVLPEGVTNCGSMFYGCRQLTQVPILPSTVTNITSMFSGCSVLARLPQDFTIPSGVTNCSGMFLSCSSLTSLPAGFTIPSGVTNCSSMFSVCSSLTEIPATLWPSGGFTSTGTIDISSAFYGCTAATGTIPGDILWNSDKTFTSTSCFTSCTNLTNYADIPATWK